MAVEFKDYYKTLGVPRSASDDEIRKAFRKLAREYHPDVAKHKGAAEEKFKEINEANEVLSDPAKRQKYDALGPNWNQPGGFRPPPGGGRGYAPQGAPAEGQEFHFNGTGFSDFFEQFFSGRGQGRDYSSFYEDQDQDAYTQRRGPARPGRNVEGDILVTLDEVVNGSVRTVSLQQTNPRTGATETHTFRVRIPPGVQENQMIRVAGKGEAGSGGAVGDLYLRVRYAKHPDFQVQGRDILYDLDLAPWEAVLGTTVSVPTLYGPVSMRVPPHTNNGAKLRLKEKGLPGRDGHKGDFYAIVRIQIPPHITEEERKLWEELARISTFHPRKQ